MMYRALFVGGPADRQERVQAHCNRHIRIRGQPQHVYRLLFGFSEPRTLVYSLYGVEETLNRLWHRYSEGDPC